MAVSAIGRPTPADKAGGLADDAVWAHDKDQLTKADKGVASGSTWIIGGIANTVG